MGNDSEGGRKQCGPTGDHGVHGSAEPQHVTGAGQMVFGGFRFLRTNWSASDFFCDYDDFVRRDECCGAWFSTPDLPLVSGEISAETLELRTLRAADESSFRAAVDEFSKEIPPWQFAFGFDDPVEFSDYVKNLEDQSRGIGVREGFVPNTFLVGIVGGMVVGRVSIRHSLNENLAKVGGHIGYGVIPSQRRRGFATVMLRRAIPVCRTLCIERALITCDEENVGSRKVVEACGGVFEGLVECPESRVPKRRYWIDTAPK